MGENLRNVRVASCFEHPQHRHHRETQQGHRLLRSSNNKSEKVQDLVCSPVLEFLESLRPSSTNDIYTNSTVDSDVYHHFLDKITGLQSI